METKSKYLAKSKKDLSNPNVVESFGYSHDVFSFRANFTCGHTETLRGLRRISTCTIFFDDKVFTGSAILHPQDENNDFYGNKVAYERAVKNLVNTAFYYGMNSASSIPEEYGGRVYWLAFFDHFFYCAYRGLGPATCFNLSIKVANNAEQKFKRNLKKKSIERLTKLIEKEVFTSSTLSVNQRVSNVIDKFSKSIVPMLMKG